MSAGHPAEAVGQCSEVAGPLWAAAVSGGQSDRVLGALGATGRSVDATRPLYSSWELGVSIMCVGRYLEAMLKRC